MQRRALYGGFCLFIAVGATFVVTFSICATLLALTASIAEDARPTLSETEIANRNATASIIALTPTDTDTPSLTPTDTDLPSPTQRPPAISAPSITLTPSDTPEPTNTPVPLETAVSGIDGITDVHLVAIIPKERGYIVHMELSVAPGHNTEETAQALLQASYTTLATAFIDFFAILNDGNTAIDWKWDNDDDVWTQTRLSTPIPLPPVQPQPTQRPLPTLPASSGFNCDCNRTCSAITTCEEAYYQLNCGCRQRDSDDDGVPCESICPGG